MTKDENSGDEIKERREPKVRVSQTPDIDEFWRDYGKKSVTDTVYDLDERAKFMITTCASLIVIDFGLLLAFNIASFSIKVTSQFFFAISAACFVMSLFPRSRSFDLQIVSEIKNSYDSWRKWKQRWHCIAFGFFIAALFTITVTSLIG
jgi:hypothetical protein